jgi:hypothetical protein
MYAPITSLRAPLPHYPKAQIRQGADRISATPNGGRQRAGAGAQRASCAKRVMPERVMSQKPLAAVVSPLGAFGGKATREHRIRVRSQRSERLQFPALRAPQLESWR